MKKLIISKVLSGNWHSDGLWKLTLASVLADHMSSKIIAGAPWTSKFKILWNALFYFIELLSWPLGSYVLRDHLQRRNAKGPGTLQCWQSMAIRKPHLKRLTSCINLNWENHTLSSAFGLAELRYLGSRLFISCVFKKSMMVSEKPVYSWSHFQFFSVSCFSSFPTNWPMSSFSTESFQI